MSAPAKSELLARARDIVPLLAAEAAAGRAACRLSDRSISAMREAGLFQQRIGERIRKQRPGRKPAAEVAPPGKPMPPPVSSARTACNCAMVGLLNVDWLLGVISTGLVRAPA